LPVLLKEDPALRAAGFHQADIVKIANNTGAAQTLSILSEVHSMLLEAHYTHEMIFNIATTRSAAKKLTLLERHQAALRAHGQYPAMIAKKARGAAPQFESWIKQQL
jgi:hypothetical protein